MMKKVQDRALGVYLPQSVFSYGQLQVALSRADMPHKIVVIMSNIRNVHEL